MAGDEWREEAYTLDELADYLDLSAQRAVASINITGWGETATCSNDAQMGLQGYSSGLA